LTKTEGECSCEYLYRYLNEQKKGSEE